MNTPSQVLPKVIIVMPAYNAEKTLEQTYRDIPPGCADAIIVVDDASRDRTVEVAKNLGLQVHQHPKNKGYGGNQKTCYQLALEAGADIVVMLHPDHQYDPQVIPDLIRPLQEGRCDAVFGSRMLGGKFLEGGMPLWKFYGNIFLTALENMTLEIFLTECHSGFRAYSRRFLETVNFQANSDHFVFDTQIIVQAVHHGFQIYEIPIVTRYFKEASQIDFWHSCKYGLDILATLVAYKLHRWKLRRAKFLFSKNPCHPDHREGSPKSNTRCEGP